MLYDSFRTSETSRLGQAFRSAGKFDEIRGHVDPVQEFLKRELAHPENDPGDILKAWLRENGILDQP